MQGLYVMLAMAGIFCVVMGVVTLKFPMLAWKLNWSRRMYVKGGEPTEEYFASRRISGVIAVLVGIFFTLGGICSLITGLRGFVVKVDGEKLSLPCTYEDITDLGYQIDASEEIKTLKASTEKDTDSVTYIARNGEGKEMEITFANRGAGDALATDCVLIGIVSKAATGPDIELPKGISMGMTEDAARPRMGDILRNYSPTGVIGFELPEDTPDLIVEYMEEVSLDHYTIRLGFDGEFVSDRRIVEIKVVDDEH